jgi:hypothetical protein
VLLLLLLLLWHHDGITIEYACAVWLCITDCTIDTSGITATTDFINTSTILTVISIGMGFIQLSAQGSSRTRVLLRR